MKDFDAYAEWLQIPAERRPPTYYDLLGLPAYEADGDRIYQAAMRRMNIVRRYHLGANAAVSLRLQNEISRALDCFRDTDQKRRYDEELLQRTVSDATGATQFEAGAAEAASVEVPTAVAPAHSAQVEPPRSAVPPPIAERPRPLCPPSMRAPVGIAPIPLQAAPAEGFGVSINVKRPPTRRRSGWSSLPPWQRWTAFGGGAMALLLGIVLLVRTPRGTIEIELSDPDAKVTVAVDGNRIDIAGLDQPLSLEVGEHAYTLKGNGFETQTKRFRVIGGKNAPLTITLMPKPARPEAAGNEGKPNEAKTADGFVDRPNMPSGSGEDVPVGNAKKEDVKPLEVVGKDSIEKASTNSLPLAIAPFDAEQAHAPRVPPGQLAAEKLAKPLTVKFLRNTLEKQLSRLAEATDIEIVVLKEDLIAAGITKNQSFSVNENDQPAQGVLRRILRLANPAGKLVYVIKPKAEGGEAIHVTTRAAAEKRGDALPPELAAASATNGGTSTAGLGPNAPLDLTILEARWGGGKNWVDVTQELRASVRDGRYMATADLNAVGNKDPLPGYMKTLSIRYSLGGQTRTEVFGDGQFVYLAASDPSARRSARLTLLEAKHGGGNTWVDVLDKLKPFVRNNSLSVPANGVVRPGKRLGGYYPNALFVRYALGGRTATAVAHGGDTLRIDGRAVARPGETVDLLKWIDPKRDAIRGDWSMASGKLITAATANSLLEIPFSPPAEYKLTLSAFCQRHDAALMIGLVAGGRQGRLMLDGWAKRKSDLDLIDGLNAGNGNPTVRNGPVLRDGESNVIVCEVRAGRITAECNGARIIDWSGNVERLSLEPSYRTRDSSHLFLGSWDTPFEISRMELLPLGDAAQDEKVK